MASESPDIDTLADLHEAPWSAIEGAHVRVRQEVDNRDPLDPAHDDRTDLVTTEVREGTIAGRHIGTKVKWSQDHGHFAEPVQDMIVLDTPEDTALEVHTDRLETELLAFTPPDGGAGDGE